MRMGVATVAVATVAMGLGAWLSMAHGQASAGGAAQVAPAAQAPVAAQTPVVAVAAPVAMKVAGGTPEEAGRYIIQVAGCNDCHTPGAVMGPVPESEWLTGVAIGWRGPWGTTYASNLRLYVQEFTEETWVKVMHERKARPPMPWASMNAMSDEDLRAVYRYIKSLGKKGQAMPAYVPPGVEPKTPYLSMMPQGLLQAVGK